MEELEETGSKRVLKKNCIGGKERNGERKEEKLGERMELETRKGKKESVRGAEMWKKGIEKARKRESA